MEQLPPHPRESSLKGRRLPAKSANLVGFLQLVWAEIRGGGGSSAARVSPALRWPKVPNAPTMRQPDEKPRVGGTGGSLARFSLRGFSR